MIIITRRLCVVLVLAVSALVAVYVLPAFLGLDISTVDGEQLSDTLSLPPTLRPLALLSRPPIEIQPGGIPFEMSIGTPLKPTRSPNPRSTGGLSGRAYPCYPNTSTPIVFNEHHYRIEGEIMYPYKGSQRLFGEPVWVLYLD